MYDSVTRYGPQSVVKGAGTWSGSWALIVKSLLSDGEADEANKINIVDLS